MPPVVIDVQRAEDPRDAVHRAVQSMAEGKIVILPTDTTYIAAASGLNETAVRRLLDRLRPTDAPRDIELAVKSVAEAYDFFPELPAVADRLARRCWPGPLTLQLTNSQRDSVMSRLPELTRKAIDQDHRVHIRAPNHPLVTAIQRLTSGPLLMVPACRQGDDAAVSGADALAAIGPDVDVVLDDGPSRFRQPSTIVACEGDGFEMVRAGVISERNVRRLASLMIAVVCTGNTCRSPMAEMLLKKQIAARLGVDPAGLEDHGVLVVSAGVAAHPGSRASDQAVDVMRERGLDLMAHESRLLDERTARYSDLLLTMTRGHRMAILQRWPELEPRTFTLCHDGSDVADPVGCPVEMYRRCADQIEAQLAAWVEKLDLHKG